LTLLFLFLKELQRRLSECHDTIATQNQDGGRLTGLVGGDGANKVKDMTDQADKMVITLDKKIKEETERVKLQRQKSLEVAVRSNLYFHTSVVFCIIYTL